jgi:hypothetical protein
MIVAAKDVAKKHEDPQVGDAEGALRAAAVTIDANYGTPRRNATEGPHRKRGLTTTLLA